MLRNIKTNTQYRFGKGERSGQLWGEIIEFDKKEGTVLVNTPLGSMQFGLYEVAAWVNESIVEPVCGICNNSIRTDSISIENHLHQHKDKVFG